MPPITHTIMRPTSTSRNAETAPRYVCPSCTGPLRRTDHAAAAGASTCVACGASLRSADGVPLLIPRHVDEAYSLREVQDVYNRAYAQDGILGIHFNPVYSRATKTPLLDFCREGPNPRILDVHTGDGHLLEAQFKHVFWNGKHPGHNGTFHPVKVFPIPSEVLQSSNDAELTGRLLQMGLANVHQDSSHFLRLTLTPLRKFFHFRLTPQTATISNVLRLSSFGIIWPVPIAGVLASVHCWGELASFLLCMWIHTAACAVTWTHIRYRVPFDVVLSPFGALGISTPAVWLQHDLAPRRNSLPYPDTQYLAEGGPFSAK